jgi:hypothetical protein
MDYDSEEICLRPETPEQLPGAAGNPVMGAPELTNIS